MNTYFNLINRIITQRDVYTLFYAKCMAWCSIHFTFNFSLGYINACFVKPGHDSKLFDSSSGRIISWGRSTVTHWIAKHRFHRNVLLKQEIPYSFGNPIPAF
jgi:hypothetical protein